MKTILLSITLLATLFATDDAKLYKKLKSYDDNLTTKKIDANINKVVIKKDKETKFDKIIKKEIKKIKATKFTKEIKKEAPASK